MTLTQYKDSHKLLITNRVSCSDEFFIKCLISKKRNRKTKRSVFFSLLGLRYNELFYFPFHDPWGNTVCTISKLQATQGQYEGDEE